MAIRRETGQLTNPGPRNIVLARLYCSLATFSVIVGIWLSAGEGSFLGSAYAQTGTTDSIQRLEEIKLREEIHNLRSERSIWRSLPVYLTGLAGIGGLTFAFLRLGDERRRDRIQREAERVQKLEEKVAVAVRDLADEKEQIQAGAAITLLSLPQEIYAISREQIFWVVLAHLRFEHSRLVHRLLGRAFERIKTYSATLEDPEYVEPLLNLGDLTATATFDNTDLSGFDFSGADLARSSFVGANLTRANLHRVRGFGANLSDANLTEARLDEARFDDAMARGTRFHQARLVGASLKRANLLRAEFQAAALQSAHFEGSNLDHAHFEMADLNEAYFLGARFDDVSLKSIVRATNWRRAHFDPSTAERLGELEEFLGRAASDGNTNGD